jgi:hypothetical protein
MAFPIEVFHEDQTPGGVFCLRGGLGGLRIRHFLGLKHILELRNDSGHGHGHGHAIIILATYPEGI